jgi:hypothetical protein
MGFQNEKYFVFQIPFHILHVIIINICFTKIDKIQVMELWSWYVTWSYNWGNAQNYKGKADTFGIAGHFSLNGWKASPSYYAI